jgi:hypothetical protein
VVLVARCGASAETVVDDRRALVGVLKYRGGMGEHLKWGCTAPPSVSQGRDWGRSTMGMFSATVGQRVFDKTHAFDKPSPRASTWYSGFRLGLDLV